MMLVGAVCACTLAPLTAYNPVSSSAILDQLLALGGWGVLMLVAGGKRLRWRGGPAAWALGLLALSPWASLCWAGLPLSMAMSYSGMLLFALLVLLLGQSLGQEPDGGESRQRWFEAICWALLLAGLLCLFVALVQVFWPALADGDFIAKSSIVGRAIGNMRQPNHLAIFLLWAMAAAVYLSERGRLGTSRASWLLMLIICFALVMGLVLSASRAAQACLLLLSIWGWLDRKLNQGSRRALKLLPLFLLICWGAMAIWAQHGHQTFHAGARLSEGMASPKRWLVLRDAWALLQQHPWTGVGWGEFNFAWTMTVNPDRPTPAFDHTHNLVLQLLVELGWPLGGLVLLLLALALWQGLSALQRTDPDESMLCRCAWVSLGLILAFSMVEFPLWYGYFLFPSVFILGLASSESSGSDLPGRAAVSVPVRYLGALTVALAATALMDYLRIVSIRDEAGLDIPVWENVVEAQQRSVFFPLHADYYAAVMLQPGSESLAAARRAAHLICDEPLLMAWSKSLAATGDTDRARFLAQRVREFNGPPVRDWFRPCESPTPGESEQPFQCQPPARAYGLQELRGNSALP